MSFDTSPHGFRGMGSEKLYQKMINLVQPPPNADHLFFPFRDRAKQFCLFALHPPEFVL
jgi:hypothetical protein